MERIIIPLDLEKEMEGYFELFAKSFDVVAIQRESPTTFKWLFEENPYNPTKEILVYIMKEGEKVIAADGLFPHELNINGKTYQCSHSIRSMTDPDYKRQGIFRKMTTNSLEEAEKHNMDLVIGFANKFSFPAYKNFGWIISFPKESYGRHVVITPRVIQKIKLKFLAEIANGLWQIYDKCRMKKIKTIKKIGVTFEEYDAVPEKAEEVWFKFRDMYPICTNRDYRYLNYRYNLRSQMDSNVKYKTIIMNDKDGAPIGFIVLRSTLIQDCNCFVICEVFTNPEEQNYTDALFEYIVEYSRREKYYMLLMSSSDFGKYVESAKKYGFYSTPDDATMVVKIYNDEIKESDLLASDKWYYTDGDGEYEWLK